MKLGDTQDVDFRVVGQGMLVKEVVTLKRSNSESLSMEDAVMKVQPNYLPQENWPKKLKIASWSSLLTQMRTSQN